MAFTLGGALALGLLSAGALLIASSAKRAGWVR